jgi:hypothetical protein
MPEIASPAVSSPNERRASARHQHPSYLSKHLICYRFFGVSKIGSLRRYMKAGDNIYLAEIVSPKLERTFG